MSYEKTTWVDGDVITAAKLNKNENQTALNEPLHVPFAVTADGQGNMSASTDADYATVRAAVIAGRTVIADVTAPGGLRLRVQLWGWNDTDLFFAVMIMPNSAAAEAEYYSIYWSAIQVLFVPKKVALS